MDLVGSISSVKIPAVHRANATFERVNEETERERGRKNVFCFVLGELNNMKLKDEMRMFHKCVCVFMCINAQIFVYVEKKKRY